MTSYSDVSGSAPRYSTKKADSSFGIVYVNIGLFLIVLGVGMFIPAIVDASNHNDDWQVFAFCSSFITFLGALLFLSNKAKFTSLSIKQGFLITVSTWLAIPFFGALPFIFADLHLSVTDAFFEAMSGVTTTGSTVITGLDGLPPGILLWRSLLQWLGGVGIIAMGVAIMPILKVGGMQLFKIEAFDTSENFIPRSTSLAISLTVLYIGLTLICGVILWLCGMSPFDAACHAFTTISTGGFSTSDSSVAYFDNALIEYVISFFMIIGSLPFIIYLKMLVGRSLKPLNDSQIKGFVIVLAFFISLVTIWLCIANNLDFFQSLRYTTFNIISVITGTGFASIDYTIWGSFSSVLFFFIMFIGGCSGSTSCGIKIFRFQVMLLAIKTSIKRWMWPNGIHIAKYNGQPVTNNIIGSVFSFVFLFVLSLSVLTLLLTLTGLDFTTAISGAGTALANVGPGIGHIVGPAGNFQTLPDVAKWILSFGMLLGRLEIFSVLVLLSPAFWKQ